MRITQVMNTATGGAQGWWTIPVQFGHGKGLWGPRKMRYTFAKQFRKNLRANTPLKVVPTDARNFVPAGVKVFDALQVAREDFHPPISTVQFPWPFTVVGEIGSKEDPDFRSQPALLYNRYLVLYEGMKGAMNFTNAVMEEEGSLPKVLKEHEEKIELKDEWLQVLRQRIQWTIKHDSTTIKLPKNVVFPELNKPKPRDYGNPAVRKELNVLRAFHEVAQKLASLDTGRYIDTRMVDSPHCVVPFIRDSQLVVMNLTSDFMTICHQSTVPASQTTQSANPEVSDVVQALPMGGRIVSHSLPVYSANPMTTVSKQLEDISPVDWRINFDETNFYPNTYGFSLPSNCRVHTLFLSNNNQVQKLQPDRMVQARALLYLYGITVSQARRLYGVPSDHEDSSNYLPINDSGPITSQAVYYNQTKNNLGFICFQLNTLGFDTKIKNQVWTDGPYDIETEQDVILKKLIAMEAARSDMNIVQN